MSRLSGLNHSDQQIVIARLITSINVHLTKYKKYQHLIITPETVVKSDKVKVPDMVLFSLRKNANRLPILIFEVCWKAKLQDDIEKVRDMMDKQSSIKEGFIITQDTFEVRKVSRKKNGELAKKESKSARIDEINYDFSANLRGLDNEYFK